MSIPNSFPYRWLCNRERLRLGVLLDPPDFNGDGRFNLPTEPPETSIIPAGPVPASPTAASIFIAGDFWYLDSSIHIADQVPGFIRGEYLKLIERRRLGGFGSSPYSPEVSFLAGVERLHNLAGLPSRGTVEACRALVDKTEGERLKARRERAIKVVDRIIRLIDPADPDAARESLTTIVMGIQE